MGGGRDDVASVDHSMKTTTRFGVVVFFVPAIGYFENVRIFVKGGIFVTANQPKINYV